MDRRAQAVLLFAAAAGIAIVGYFEFRFLTDDAYISFRYAANALAGRGLVWNPHPFLPVEGYTNFGWVVLLGVVWAVFGIEPPAAANPLALAFGLGTLALALRIGLRMSLPSSWERARPALVALVAVGIVSNRTYLAWLSSGLETALFNFALTAWIACALEPPAERTPRATLALAAAAAAAALTRPDGWLAVAGCAPLAWLAWRARRPAARDLAAWSPLLLPLLHVAWRRSYYGEWLPNTWYAKNMGAWAESGVRYAASFALEYALWLWLAFALFWLLRRPRPSAQAAVAVAVLLAHFGYYTFAIGGDHFEYRVYSHLVPLLFVSAAWLLAQARVPRGAGVALLAAFVALSWPIPWAHHLATRDLETRAETHKLVVPVAPRLLPPLRWLASPFDDLQAWLIPRHVGMRHREHAVFHDRLVESLPTRSEGSQIGWDQRAVLLAGNVGVIGWAFPDVAIIDVLGLNDYVVARTPVPSGEEREMAHDRLARPDYLACYRPNLTIQLPRRYTLRERPTPLTDADIAACERTWRARAGEPIEIPPGMELQRR
jgi:arabinofuranosyltransferase